MSNNEIVNYGVLTGHGFNAGVTFMKYIGELVDEKEQGEYHYLNDSIFPQLTIYSASNDAVSFDGTSYNIVSLMKEFEKAATIFKAAEVDMVINLCNSTEPLMINAFYELAPHIGVTRLADTVRTTASDVVLCSEIVRKDKSYGPDATYLSDHVLIRSSQYTNVPFEKYEDRLPELPEGTKRVILGCTDLSCIKDDIANHYNIHVIDPVYEVAKRVVDFHLARLQNIATRESRAF